MSNRNVNKKDRNEKKGSGASPDKGIQRRSKSLRLETKSKSDQKKDREHRRSRSDSNTKQKSARSRKASSSHFATSERKSSLKTRSRFKVEKKLGPRDIGKIDESSSWKPAHYDDLDLHENDVFLMERHSKRYSPVERKQVKRKLGPREIGRSDYKQPAFKLRRNTDDFLQQRLQYRANRTSSEPNMANVKKTRSRFQVEKKLGPRDINKDLHGWKPPNYNLGTDTKKNRGRRSKSIQVKRSVSERKRRPATISGPKRKLELRKTHSDSTLLKRDPINSVVNHSHPFRVVQNETQSITGLTPRNPETPKQPEAKMDVNIESFGPQEPASSVKSTPPTLSRRRRRRKLRTPEERRSNLERRLSQYDTFENVKHSLAKESEKAEVETRRLAKLESEGNLRDPAVASPSAPAVKHERHLSDDENHKAKYTFTSMVSGSPIRSNELVGPRRSRARSRRLSFADIILDDVACSPRSPFKMSMSSDSSGELSELETGENFGETRCGSPERAQIDSYTLFHQLDEIYDKKGKKLKCPEQLFERLNKSSNMTVEVYPDIERAPGAPSPRPKSPFVQISSPGRPPPGSPARVFNFPNKVSLPPGSTTPLPPPENSSIACTNSTKGSLPPPTPPLPPEKLSVTFTFPQSKQEDPHAFVVSIILSFLNIDSEGDLKQDVFLVLHTMIVNLTESTDSARSSSKRWESESGTSATKDDDFSELEPKLQFAKFLHTIDDLTDEIWKNQIETKVQELDLLDDSIVLGTFLMHNWDVIDLKFTEPPNRIRFKSDLCNLFGEKFQKILDTDSHDFESEGFPMTLEDYSDDENDGEPSVVEDSSYSTDSPKEKGKQREKRRPFLRQSSEGQTKRGVIQVQSDSSDESSPPASPTGFRSAWKNAQANKAIGEVDSPHKADSLDVNPHESEDFNQPMYGPVSFRKDNFSPGTPPRRFPNTPSPRSVHSKDSPPASPNNLKKAASVTPPGTPALDEAKEGEEIQIVNRESRVSSFASDSSFSSQEALNIPDCVRSWNNKKLASWVRTWNKKLFNGHKLARVFQKNRGITGMILPLNALQLGFLTKKAKVKMTQIEIEQSIFWFHTFLLDEFGAPSQNNSPRAFQAT